jgi:hypothetical protein
MAEERTDVTDKDLRRALSALVSDGLKPYNVGERGGRLLDLELVRMKLPAEVRDDEDHKDYDDLAAGALREVLIGAVTKRYIDSRKHRRVLKAVFELREDDVIGQPLASRRDAAATAISGEKVIQAETVRTYYEPRALNALARALVRLENELVNGKK